MEHEVKACELIIYGNISLLWKLPEARQDVEGEYPCLLALQEQQHNTEIGIRGGKQKLQCIRVMH